MLNEIDNLAIYITPQEPQGGVPCWFAGIAADPKNKVEAHKDQFLPPLWKGKYASGGHFYKLDRTDPANLASCFQEYWLLENEISHLALLESDHKPSGPMYFAGDVVRHISVVLWFSEKRKKFYYIHCRKCVFSLLEWMMAMQETWSRTATIVGRA